MTTKKAKLDPIENNRKALTAALVRMLDNPMELPKASNRPATTARMTLARLAHVLSINDIFDLSQYVKLPALGSGVVNTKEIVTSLKTAGFEFTGVTSTPAQHSVTDFFAETLVSLNPRLLHNMIIHHLMVTHGRMAVAESQFADAVGWSVLRAAFMYGDTESFFDSIDSDSCRNMSVIVTTRQNKDSHVNHHVYPLTGNFDSAKDTLIAASIPKSATFTEAKKSKEAQISIARRESSEITAYVSAPLQQFELGNTTIEYALFLHWSGTTQQFKVPSVAERLDLISSIHKAFAK